MGCGVGWGIVVVSKRRHLFYKFFRNFAERNIVFMKSSDNLVVGAGRAHAASQQRGGHGVEHSLVAVLQGGTGGIHRALGKSELIMGLLQHSFDLSARHHRHFWRLSVLGGVAREKLLQQFSIATRQVAYVRHHLLDRVEERVVGVDGEHLFVALGLRLEHARPFEFGSRQLDGPRALAGQLHQAAQMHPTVLVGSQNFQDLPTGWRECRENYPLLMTLLILLQTIKDCYYREKCITN